MTRTKGSQSLMNFNPPMRDRILLAIRPGEIESGDLNERLNGGYSVEMERLIKDGLVIKQGTYKEVIYKLTAQGRAACPRWRDVLRTPQGELAHA